MDSPILLSSRGAIVGGAHFVPLLGIVPYVENVAIPVVSTDLSAIYGAHPENLATVTISSGAALTFFVDSVAGGNDMSGNGSYDNPWRSMRAAAKFLRCAECTLAAAAAYVQVKVRGTVDYLPGDLDYQWWEPWTSHTSRLILAGWGTRCDLGSVSGAGYAAGYYFNLSGSAFWGVPSICSDCTITGSGSAFAPCTIAVNCELSRALIYSAAIDCSGGLVSHRRTPPVPTVVHGGRYGDEVYCDYMYGTFLSGGGMRIESAAVSATARIYSTFSNGGDHAVMPASAGYRAYFGDCQVSGGVVVSGGTNCQARFSLLGGASYSSGIIVSGGNWMGGASAYALASGNDNAWAVAAAGYFPADTIVHNVSGGGSASASAVCSGTLNYRVSATEIEVLDQFLGASCRVERKYYYSNSVVTSTSITSSGSCP